jgi:nucleotide-binding universal stress UspA family protein
VPVTRHPEAAVTTPTPLHVTFENILIPTDFTDVAKLALGYAKAIARQADSQLLLVHVNPPLAAIDSPELAWVDAGVILKSMEERLERSSADLRSEGFRVGTLSVNGSLQDEILFLVERENVDLIVLGTHSKTGLERLMFGSDAESILRRVSCPVLTVGPRAAKPSAPVWPPANVLCATTLDPDAAAGTAAYAFVLAHQLAARFGLLTVAEEKGASYGASLEAFEHAVKRRLPADSSFQVHMQTVVSQRAPGIEIAEYATKHGVDLVVMGAHTASALATHFAHGTANQVFADAPCPVMTVLDPQE